MLKTNVTKRIFSLLLALIMLVGTIPFSVLAQEMDGGIVADRIVIDSNTINEELATTEPENTATAKFKITFNPNGGVGTIENVEVDAGSKYTLPNNVFIAPQNQEFDSWFLNGAKYKEGETLYINSDLEIKALWKEKSVNFITKIFNKIMGKEETKVTEKPTIEPKKETTPKLNSTPKTEPKEQTKKDELEVSEDKVKEAVSENDPYVGPAHNSVVSSDGKVQIRNFEVFWASTEEDMIVDTRTPEFKYYYYEFTSKFNHEPKFQINWALSGEIQYPKGAMTITIPDMQFEDDNDLKYVIGSYSIPKAVFKEDGSIDLNEDYGNATLVYYYDEESKSTKIINIQELAPGASGTFTLSYSYYRDISGRLKDMSILQSKPFIELNYNKEILKTEDKTLKIQQNTSFDAYIYKQGELFKTWQNDWGNEFKPENSEDYWYVCYQISVEINDEAQTNLDYKLIDTIGDIYEYKDDKSLYSKGSQPDKTINGEQEIIGYTDIKTKKEDTYRVNFTNKSMLKDSIEWSGNLNEAVNHHMRGTKYIYVLSKIPAKKLGYMDEKKSHYIKATNNVKLEVTPRNSDDEKQIKEDSSENKDSYTYVPDVEFTAPPGDMFSLKKEAYHTHARYLDYNWEYVYEVKMGWNSDKDKNYDYLVYEYPHTDNLYGDRDIYWAIGGSARVANATYDEKYKNDENPADAYGKKKIKYELVDDYLYLGDDYSKELTPEDYSVKKIYFNDISHEIGSSKCAQTNVYDYTQKDKKSKADYIKVPSDKTGIPAALYLRKSSTGEWEKAAEFQIEIKSIDYRKPINFKPLISGVNIDYSTITLPEGYSSVKIVCETNYAGLDLGFHIKGTLHPTERVKKYIDSSKSDYYLMNIKIRNDSTFLAYDENGKMLGLQGTTKSSSNVDRTLELDRQNYGVEMYHDPVHLWLRQKPISKVKRKQYITKFYTDKYFYREKFKNDIKNKQFIIPTHVQYYEGIENYKEHLKDPLKTFHIQNSGRFYDLLPLGVTGVQNVNVEGETKEVSGYKYTSFYQLVDKNSGSNLLNSKYKLIPNWRNSGRTMLIVDFFNAKLKDEGLENINTPTTTVVLNYKMIYPWDSYKDYGSGLKRNLVAYESGFEKKDNDGMDDDLTNDLEYGYSDSNPGFWKEYNSYYNKLLDKKTFTDQEIEWMKDLNPNHDEKRFLYEQASTSVFGDTEANVGLTKHVKSDINPNFTLKSKTKEGGNYEYKIRLQASHGTSVSDLIFFDSIENYEPLQADEDYGVKRWRGTLSSIDVSHPIMKGVDPKVYVSTTPKLDIEQHNDITDSSIWKLYNEGDDLSTVQAVAIDLRKNKDGSDFKLEQGTAINVYFNMKVPWNLKEKQIDPEAKALNAIYASNTVTTTLDNKSTKLIYTAYTAIDLEPSTTEATIKATKKHLDKEGNEIALKGNDFTFELKDSTGATLQTKTNDANGDITFDPIKYNSWDVGEHTYKIVEVKGDSETTAYDDHEETVTVKVERVGDTDLKADITYSTENALFTNHEVDSITTSLEAKKVYIGKGGVEEKPKKDAFEFVLKDLEGKEIARAKNDAEGKVVFEGLEFKPNQTGEYKYTIEEVKGNNPAIEYDNTKKNVTINVSLGTDFKLKADVVYENNETPTFTNTLKAASLQLVKVKNGVEAFPLDEVKENEFLVGYKVPQDKIDLTLNGAEYELYKINEDNTQTLVTTLVTENGISKVVNDLTSGDYILKETKAPQGYLFGEDIKFSITDKEAGTIIVKFATDKGLVDMPSTGGRGTKALMIGGGILLIVMACLFILARKKKDKQTIK